MVRDTRVSPGRTEAMDCGRPDRRRGPRGGFFVWLGSSHRGPVRPGDGLARAWPAFSLASPPRAVDDAAAGRNGRVSELPRGRARRHRDFPSSLRGDRAECFGKPAFSPFSRVQPPGASAHQPHPVQRQSSDVSIQCFHSFPNECAIVRTQSLFELTVAHVPKCLRARRIWLRAKGKCAWPSSPERTCWCSSGCGVVRMLGADRSPERALASGDCLGHRHHAGAVHRSAR